MKNVNALTIDLERFLKKTLSASALVDLHNSYCFDVGDLDSFINDMDELDDVFSDMSPSYFARRVFYGDFNPNHPFFMFNGYGNLVSLEDPLDKIDLWDIARYIVTEDKDFGRLSIRDWLVENAE